MNKLSYIAIGTVLTCGGMGPQQLYAATDLGSFPIEVTGMIVGEGCSAVIEGPDLSNIDLGKIPLTDVVKSTSHVKKTVQDANIKFTCEEGKKAKWSVTVNSAECKEKTVGNWRFSCGGENQTVGLAAKFAYLDSAGVKKEVIGKADLGMEGNIYELLLDEKGQGVISIPSVEYSKLKDVKPVPGRVAVAYTLNVWGD